VSTAHGISVEAQAALLWRTIMNHIHEGGSIWYNDARLHAYCIVAKIASDARQELIRRYA
jgi:hypothetical protein